MSNRRQGRPLNDKLHSLEQDLASLTLRVAAIRNRTNRDSIIRPLSIGDRVHFNIAGRGRAEGVIVGITAQRIRIQQDITLNIFLRAPHNVSLA
jgi:hypothetical protein